jgi:hypothetical protein
VGLRVTQGPGLFLKDFSGSQTQDSEQGDDDETHDAPSLVTCNAQADTSEREYGKDHHFPSKVE